MRGKSRRTGSSDRNWSDSGEFPEFEEGGGYRTPFFRQIGVEVKDFLVLLKVISIGKIPWLWGRLF